MKLSMMCSNHVSASSHRYTNLGKMKYFEILWVRIIESGLDCGSLFRASKNQNLVACLVNKMVLFSSDHCLFLWVESCLFLVRIGFRKNITRKRTVCDNWTDHWIKSGWSTEQKLDGLSESNSQPSPFITFNKYVTYKKRQIHYEDESDETFGDRE